MLETITCYYRAIFRWITLKDLNVMKFDETVEDTDTPLGLLRGIKYGTETYHALFLRLCRYDRLVSVCRYSMVMCYGTAM